MSDYICRFCNASHSTANGLRQHHYLLESNVNGRRAPFYPSASFNINGEWRATEYERLYGDLNLKINMRDALNESETFIREILFSFPLHVRFNVKVEVKLVKNLPNDELDIIDQFFTAPSQILNRQQDFPRTFNESVEQLLSQLETFQSNGSGWTLLQVTRVILNVSSYLPRSFGCFSKLPDELRSKTHSLLNIKDEEERCFKLAVLASCFPATAGNHNHTRPNQYLQHENEFWFPSNYPITFPDLERFCKKNRNVALTVIEYDTKSKCFFPLRCDQSDREFKVILLAVDNHFYAVKNVNALLTPSNYHYGNQSPVVFCLNCLNSFKSQRCLENHISICG